MIGRWLQLVSARNKHTLKTLRVFCHPESPGEKITRKFRVFHPEFPGIPGEFRSKSSPGIIPGVSHPELFRYPEST
jgi:hypothetical protein